MRGISSLFVAACRSLLIDQSELAPVVLPVLEAWRSIRIRAVELGRQLVADARQSQAMQHTHVDPGAITARSGQLQEVRSVAAWIGLTTAATNREKSIMTAIYPHACANNSWPTPEKFHLPAASFEMPGLCGAIRRAP